jgi:hypothetical protein
MVNSFIQPGIQFRCNFFVFLMPGEPRELEVRNCSRTRRIKEFYDRDCLSSWYYRKKDYIKYP